MAGGAPATARTLAGGRRIASDCVPHSRPRARAEQGQNTARRVCGSHNPKGIIIHGHLSCASLLPSRLRVVPKRVQEGGGAHLAVATTIPTPSFPAQAGSCPLSLPLEGPSNQRSSDSVSGAAIILTSTCRQHGVCEKMARGVSRAGAGAHLAVAQHAPERPGPLRLADLGRRAVAAEHQRLRRQRRQPHVARWPAAETREPSQPVARGPHSASSAASPRIISRFGTLERPSNDQSAPI